MNEKIEIWIFNEICVELRVNDGVVEFIKSDYTVDVAKQLAKEYALKFLSWDTEPNSMITIITCARK